MLKRGWVQSDDLAAAGCSCRECCVNRSGGMCAAILISCGSQASQQLPPHGFILTVCVCVCVCGGVCDFVRFWLSGSGTLPCFSFLFSHDGCGGMTQVSRGCVLEQLCFVFVCLF